MYISSNPWLFANWIDIPWCAFVKTPQNTLGTGGDCQGCGSLVLTTIHWYAHSINFYIHIHFAHLRFNLDLGGDFKYFFNFISSLIWGNVPIWRAYSFRWVEWNHQLEKFTEVAPWRRIGDSAFQILEGMKPWYIVGAISTAMVRPRCLVDIPTGYRKDECRM